ncbi:helix-turn-helix domain-containing protein [Streptococcus entericus]|uniref:helix-turn-helix domain-containing protein n=1 Tax=Streptococcus entericus TaxID=155680 RepID=UPI0011EA6F04
MLRAGTKMTQEEVAQKLDIATSTLSKWENGKSFPDVSEIKKLEELYNVSYADINFLPNNTV